MGTDHHGFFKSISDLKFEISNQNDSGLICLETIRVIRFIRGY